MGVFEGAILQPSTAAAEDENTVYRLPIILVPRLQTAAMLHVRPPHLHNSANFEFRKIGFNSFQVNQLLNPSKVFDWELPDDMFLGMREDEICHRAQSRGRVIRSSLRDFPGLKIYAHPLGFHQLHNFI
jgi:hypothetical protein